MHPANLPPRAWTALLQGPLTATWGLGSRGEAGVKGMQPTCPSAWSQPPGVPQDQPSGLGAPSPGKLSPLLQPHMLLGWRFGRWGLGHDCPRRAGWQRCSGAPPTGLDHAGPGGGSRRPEAPLKDRAPWLLSPGLPAGLRPLSSPGAFCSPGIVLTTGAGGRVSPGGPRGTVWGWREGQGTEETVQRGADRQGGAQGPESTAELGPRWERAGRQPAGCSGRSGGAAHRRTRLPGLLGTRDRGPQPWGQRGPRRTGCWPLGGPSTDCCPPPHPQVHPDLWSPPQEVDWGCVLPPRPIPHPSALTVTGNGLTEPLSGSAGRGHGSGHEGGMEVGGHALSRDSPPSHSQGHSFRGVCVWVGGYGP